MTKHPIEGITSVKRRRRCSPEDKERLVAACFEPGAVISEIARAASIYFQRIVPLAQGHKELCRVEEKNNETATIPDAGDRGRCRACHPTGTACYT